MHLKSVTLITGQISHISCPCPPSFPPTLRYWMLQDISSFSSHKCFTSSDYFLLFPCSHTIGQNTGIRKLQELRAKFLRKLEQKSTGAETSESSVFGNRAKGAAASCACCLIIRRLLEECIVYWLSTLLACLHRNCTLFQTLLPYAFMTISL